MGRRQFALICAVFATILFTLIVISNTVRASELREIELNDGTVITGEVVSLSKDVYTIRSSSLGTLKIKGSNIRAIRTKALGDSPVAAGERVRSLQGEITGDAEIMSLIMTLESDQDLKAILSDPETMRAVQAGDISSLMANPKFMKLLNKPEIRDIENKLRQK
jgi:hypothetical protein